VTNTFVLINSPIVPAVIWQHLEWDLKCRGFDVVLPVFGIDKWVPNFHDERASIVRAAIDVSPGKVVLVAHSGAGSIVSMIDPDSVDSIVMLDAIFPDRSASRFDLFDSAEQVEMWRCAALGNNGKIPAILFSRLQQLIPDDSIRRQFVSQLVDIPIELYEESFSPHDKWGATDNGYYWQWTSTYDADCERARKLGLKTFASSMSHLAMCNKSKEIGAFLESLVTSSL
jgi:hypothetical protein